MKAIKKKYIIPHTEAFQLMPSMIMDFSDTDRRGYTIDGTFGTSHTHNKRGTLFNVWHQDDTNSKNGWLDID